MPTTRSCSYQHPKGTSQNFRLDEDEPYAMISLFILAVAGFSSRASAVCTRDFLKEVTASYIAALSSGEGPAGISGLAQDNVTYQENDADLDIAEGVLSAAIKIDFNRSIYDTTECASYTEIVATTGHPYVIGTRLALNEDNKIYKIESVVCETGDWLFDAKGTLDYNKKERWEPIPEEQRDSREVIKAAGEAYINAWGDDKIKPPFTADCSRLEGGLYISGGKCLLNFPPPFNVTNRRFTIDEELGAIDIFHNFPFLDQSIPRDPGTQTNNLMRVEGGKIKYIHENTVCDAKNCGR